MPKITVLVDKDDMGKLWNYVFASEDKAITALASFSAQSILIHKGEEMAENPQQSLQKSPSENEGIIIGMLPLSKKQHVRTRKR